MIDGKLVYAVRERMGQILAREHPVEADLVIAVPDACDPGRHRLRHRVRAADPRGVRQEPLHRADVHPAAPGQRSGDVALKLNPLPEVLRGKRVVVVDDSIVRGTTTPRVVAQLRRAGAREVHMRISSPPMRLALLPRRGHGADRAA